MTSILTNAVRNCSTYAYNFFVDHLENIKRDEMEPAIKQDMGRKLTRMLQEDALIEAWWAPERMYLTGWHVFSENSKSLLLLIHDFLKDPSVQRGLTDMPTERQWVAYMTSGDEPNFNLYENVAKIMARRWFGIGLSYADDVTQEAFIWLLGWIQCVREKCFTLCSIH